MEITEVRIKLVEKTTERLMAFCSITIDGAFVIRDLKLIGGPHGLSHGKTHWLAKRKYACIANLAV